MQKNPTSFLSPKCEARPTENGHHGVYAKIHIAQGEILVIWGGQVATRDEFMQLPEHLRRLTIQIEEDFYLAGNEIDPADFVNHSCEPNAGLQGQIVLVAMRDIAPSEEICFDYAMTDGSDYDEFECHCGAPNCRKFVRGSDWRNPELWEKYRGYFMPYLQKRIDRLRAEMENAQKNPPR